MGCFTSSFSVRTGIGSIGTASNASNKAASYRPALLSLVTPFLLIRQAARDPKQLAVLKRPLCKSCRASKQVWFKPTTALASRLGLQSFLCYLCFSNAKASIDRRGSGLA